MFFSELYGAYYNAVAAILRIAVKQPIHPDELHRIIEENAFGESVLTMEPALKQGQWQLLHPDGTTPIKNSPSLPLTTLQKRWLKAIYAEPRVRLFTDDIPDFPEVEPLFDPEDIVVFDKYADGDPFTDKTYIRNFRLILDAIKNRYALRIDSLNHKGNRVHTVLRPDYLEYSEKDDKFRVVESGSRFGGTVNLGRITRCVPLNRPYTPNPQRRTTPKHRTVVLELVDQRNALERVLLHFAHFEKQAEKTDGGRYKVTITYDKDDETELLIRILSFGPMVKVIEPTYFVDLIKERLNRQKSCGL